jgi:hypothetical protein
MLKPPIITALSSETVMSGYGFTNRELRFDKHVALADMILPIRP